MFVHRRVVYLSAGHQTGAVTGSSTKINILERIISRDHQEGMEEVMEKYNDAGHALTDIDGNHT